MDPMVPQSSTAAMPSHNASASQTRTLAAMSPYRPATGPTARLEEPERLAQQQDRGGGAGTSYHPPATIVLAETAGNSSRKAGPPEPGGYNAPCVPLQAVVSLPSVYGSTVAPLGLAGSIEGDSLALAFRERSGPNRADDFLNRPAYHHPETLGESRYGTQQPEAQAENIRAHQWIIPQTVYSRGSPPGTPVAPAVLGILVGDVLDPIRLERLKTMDMYRVAAFPDPEGRRTRMKFSVRFMFQGHHIHEYLPQVNEYRLTEGSFLRAPLSRIEFAVVVAKQLCRYLRLSQLWFRGHAVDVRHLVIVELRRPSKASVQPTFVIHRDFRPLYG